MNVSIQRMAFSWFSFWVVVALVSMVFLFPLRKSIRYGIDLVGGTYITLEVQVDKAVETELVSRLAHISAKLATKNMNPRSKQVENNAITLLFDTALQAQDAAATITKDFKDVTVAVLENKVSVSFTALVLQRIKQEAVRRNIEVLRTRLNPLSVSEVPIAPQGERNIIVELPDVADPAQAKAMIGKPAVLEFKLVEKAKKSEDDIVYELDGELPGDKEILPGKEVDGTVHEYYLVNKYTDVTGSLLKRANADFDSQTGKVVVAFEFTAEGGDKFYELTSKNIGRRLAVVLDGTVIIAPTIQVGIHSGGSITGVTAPEAKEIATLLRSGSFVAPVTFEEERQIGPSLGHEAIRQGLSSCLVALILVFFFSVFYYRFSGFLAFMALLYNLLLILVGMALFKATLTLPGIAGMALTVGMAIDASILIFERIKEELAAGLTLKRAVNAGFSDAIKVILDANITTFIVGVVLYKFGTGPIQGFAVTMMLGIVSTLITGLFFLKSLFNFVLDNFSIQKLKF
jgi:preprotein translocase subunit SecD